MVKTCKEKGRCGTDTHRNQKDGRHHTRAGHIGKSNSRGVHTEEVTLRVGLFPTYRFLELPNHFLGRRGWVFGGWGGEVAVVTQSETLTATR